MIQRSCIVCNKEFKVKNYLIFLGRGKYCSSFCYHEASKGSKPWNKGIRGWSKTYLKGKYINCIICDKEKYFEPNQLNKRPCKFCSVKCARFFARKKVLKYSSIHARIKTDWGKADICEKCGSIKTVDWANKSSKYLLDRSDWLKLCRKCHIEYDNVYRRMWATRREVV